MKQLLPTIALCLSLLQVSVVRGQVPDSGDLEGDNIFYLGPRQSLVSSSLGLLRLRPVETAMRIFFRVSRLNDSDPNRLQINGLSISWKQYVPGAWEHVPLFSGVLSGADIEKISSYNSSSHQELVGANHRVIRMYLNQNKYNFDNKGVFMRIKYIDIIRPVGLSWIVEVTWEGRDSVLIGKDASGKAVRRPFRMITRGNASNLGAFTLAQAHKIPDIDGESKKALFDFLPGNPAELSGTGHFDIPENFQEFRGLVQANDLVDMILQFGIDLTKKYQQLEIKKTPGSSLIDHRQLKTIQDQVEILFRSEGLDLKSQQSLAARAMISNLIETYLKAQVYGTRKFAAEFPEPKKVWEETNAARLSFFFKNLDDWAERKVKGPINLLGKAIEQINLDKKNRADKLNKQTAQAESYQPNLDSLYQRLSVRAQDQTSAAMTMQEFDADLLQKSIELILRLAQNENNIVEVDRLRKLLLNRPQDTSNMCRALFR